MIPKYLAVDVESGGIDHNITSVLEYYFIVLDEEFNELGQLHLLTKPDDGVYQVTAGALGVNHINLVEHDKVAINESMAKRALYDWLDGHTEGGKHKLIPFGHNVGFDVSAIQAKLLSRQTCNKYIKYYVLDTGCIAQFLMFCGKMPKDTKFNLGGLIEHFKADGVNDHTAQGDIRATINVLKKMKELINE